MNILSDVLSSGYFENIVFISSGIFLTMQLTLGALFVSIVLGSLMAVLRYKVEISLALHQLAKLNAIDESTVKKPFILIFLELLVILINRLISLTRGTPLILQLSFFYFAVPGMFNIQISVAVAAIITFGLNGSAYTAELLRAGIQSIPAGQFEAAQTLQIPSSLMWKDIIAPQVLRNIFPALINETIALLKDTALISTLGGMDIMRRAQTVAATEFTYFWPICVAGVTYYLIILCLEYFGRRVEERWKNARNK